jgi:hypothetical protein
MQDSVHLTEPEGVEVTPGPWQWYWRVEGREANCGVYYEERPGMAHSVCRAPRYVTQEQWEANARLIAAAPLMLAALREFMDDDDVRALIGNGACERMDALIASATGTPT